MARQPGRRKAKNGGDPGYIDELVAGLQHAAATGTARVAKRIGGASEQLAEGLSAWGATASERVGQAGARLADRLQQLGRQLERS
jgi:hypothetical protein